jgi:cyclopropane fatty-acyl-phospholipid synthase-like methyltransferase
VDQYADYAEFYDLGAGGLGDVPFYLAYAGNACVAGDSPVLELGCGTGRVTIPLAEAGYEVIGVDLSEPMLARCRAKVAERGLEERVHLLLADMAQFELERADVGLACTPFRSFMHLNTQAEQLACLERTYACLRPGGTFIVDVYAPSYRAMAQEPDGPWVLGREFPLPDGHTLKRWFRFVRNDPKLQMQYYERRFEQIDAEGATVRERTFSMSHRYTFRYELQLLLERVGFEVVDVFRDYGRNPYDGTGEILAVARRPE